jgi:hypothetical protein
MVWLDDAIGERRAVIQKRMDELPMKSTACCGGGAALSDASKAWISGSHLAWSFSLAAAPKARNSRVRRIVRRFMSRP